MRSRNLRRYAVCRTCSEIYPSALGCPDCDGDERARFEMARARTGYVGAAEPPIEGIRPKVQRILHGSATEPASLTWLRRHAASISVTIVMCTTLLLIVLHLS